MMMDTLYAFHDNMLKQVDDRFHRYLYEQINWDQQLIAIKGPRGAGKTTMMLQRIRFQLKDNPAESLYISADHHWFYTHTLADTADEFVKGGGQHLFIDEVHKYPHWSSEIKNIYDAYPGLRVVVSASSALELYKGEADLSRRMVAYELSGMSLREFLKLNGQGDFPAIPFDKMIEDHVKITREISDQLRPLAFFKDYLKYGYLPFYSAGQEKEYLIKILQVINTILESDLAVVAGISAGATYKVKKLLGILSESVPFKPNIAELARKLDASRDSVYDWITLLGRARLLNLLITEGKSTALLQKPEKIYLENPNLAYALISLPDTGNIRETFLFSQLTNAGFEIFAPKTGDFKTADHIIEVGGMNKPASDPVENYIVAADNIENGYKNKIPLWLFGFLY